MSVSMQLYILNIGSNEGSRLRNIINSIKLLNKRGYVVNISDVYLTEPFGFEQQWFINVGAVFLTRLYPSDLLDVVKEIECFLGRKPTVKWGPRVIDIDIIMWSGGAYRDERLVIPHKMAFKRGFVVETLRDFGFNLDKVEDGLSVIRLDAASIFLKKLLFNF